MDFFDSVLVGKMFIKITVGNIIGGVDFIS